MQLAFWRREPKTHEKIGVHPGDVALRIFWVLAVIAVMLWAWAKL